MPTAAAASGGHIPLSILNFPQILDQKLDCIRETGAEIVAVECPGCLMQLRKGLAERGEKAAEARVLAEILADQL